MHFAILGTGDVGRTLAAGLFKHGHDVTLGTRDPGAGKLQAWLDDNPGIEAATFAEAAQRAEAVIVALNWSAVEAVLRDVSVHCATKLVIDVTNPLASGGDGPPVLAVAGADSAGESVQRWLPNAQVVKCWNIVGHPHMVDPDLPEAPTMFIAGDDRVAKEDVRVLLDQVGWPDVVDIGGIEASRHLEGLAMVWIQTYFATGNGGHAFRLVRS